MGQDEERRKEEGGPMNATHREEVTSPGTEGDACGEREGVRIGHLNSYKTREAANRAAIFIREEERWLYSKETF